MAPLLFRSIANQRHMHYDVHHDVYYKVDHEQITHMNAEQQDIGLVSHLLCSDGGKNT